MYFISYHIKEIVCELSFLALELPLAWFDRKSMIKSVSMAAIYPLRAFQDNYIWVIRQGQDAAVVDPGDARPVLEHLKAERLKLCDILVTHHHGDHIGGLPELTAEFNVPVYGPVISHIPYVTHALKEGDTVNLPALDLSLRVMESPGHTLDHIAYYGNGRLFCGDTLFACGCGRLFEGTAAQLYASLQKFAALPGDTAVYCAHEYTLNNIRFAKAVGGECAPLLKRETVEVAKRAKDQPTVPSTIQLELKTNPFLRCADAGFREELRVKKIIDDDNPVRAFAVLRSWKDRF